MRILVVSHAYVERDNHKKLQILSSHKDLEVGLIYPKKWRTWHGENKVESSKLRVESSYREFTLDTFFSGDGGKYFYNPIQLIISVVKFRPDLIYLEEEPFSFVSCQLSVVSWFLRIKLIFFTWENLDLPLGNLRSFIEKITFKAASKAVAGNLEAAERLKKKGFLKPTTVIPQFGVDTEAFCPDPFARPRLANGVVLGFVGRPTLTKGIDTLLEALSKLPEKYKLLWVTSSVLIPSVITDQIIRYLGLERRVRIERNVPHDKLVDYYRQMDIYVLPSRTTPTWKEQFGRTLIEAMACGVPVLGSSSGAIPEVIGNAGLIFKEGDSENLAKILGEMTSPAQREKLIESGIKRVMDNFTYSKIDSDLYEFISQ